MRIERDMAPRSSLLIAAIAALQGAAGVVLAAVSAHVVEASLLDKSSAFLLFHAGAGLALAALARTGPYLPRGLILGSFALQTGVTLFSVDLAFRVFAAGALFPYAAPIGGGLTIVSWILLALWAIMNVARTDAPHAPM